MKAVRITASCALLLTIAKACLRFSSLETTRTVLNGAACVLGARADGSAVEPIVLRASSRLPWRTTCLHEALAGEALLRNAGLKCELRIGARREAATYRFHAWVDYNGVVIIGATDVPHAVLLSS